MVAQDDGATDVGHLAGRSLDTDNATFYKEELRCVFLDYSAKLFAKLP